MPVWAAWLCIGEHLDRNPESDKDRHLKQIPRPLPGFSHHSRPSVGGFFIWSAELAGTIFSLGLSQQVDRNGDPLSGCKLFIWEAGTTTPAIAYNDTNLTDHLPWPLEADANGRLPPFWVPDGTYRVRLTDRNGVQIFDYPAFPAIGPSSDGGGGGGGGGDSTDPNAIFQTGDVLWLPRSGTRAGWVRENGRTIGSAASGATERANSDCQSLYEYLWANYSDEFCPVTGGRGVSASADWAANKPIATLDMRGRLPCGIDNMGAGVSSGRLSSVTFDGSGGSNVPGSTAGSATHTITQGNLPNINLTAQAAGAHDHFTVRNASTSNPGGAADLTPTNSIAKTYSQTDGDEYNYNLHSNGTNARPDVSRTSQDGLHQHTVPLGGSGTALLTIPPIILGTFYIKL